MQSDDFNFRAPDGTALQVYAWTRPEPKAVVQILHGMAEHSARYARLAQVLVNAGYAVYASDHRGHGRNVLPGAPPGHMADLDSWTRVVEDAHLLNREIAKRHPGSPIIMVGHSMGSYMVQQLLYEHPTDMVAAALSGSSGKPPPIAMLGKIVARIERRRVGKRASSPLIQRLTFGEFNTAFKPNRTEFDWLSRDAAEVDAYVRDPLCGFACSTQTWIDLLDALGRLANPNNVARVPKDMPIYLFAGAEDPVGEQGASVQKLYEAYRKAGVANVTLKLYPDARHETLNETNRDEVMNDLVKWCDANRAGHSPHR